MLDVGGVLVLPNCDELCLVGNRPPASKAEVHEAYFRAIAQRHAESSEHLIFSLGACLGVSAALIEIAVANGLDPDFVLWRDPLLADGAIELLRSMMDEGMPVVIVSNSNGTVEDSLRDAGLCQVGEGLLCSVAAVVDSHAIGFEKPDSRIFHAALQLVGGGAGDAVMVGDLAWADVEGAENAGIEPWHLDPFNFCDDGGHAHVKSLLDVEQRIIERSRVAGMG